MKTIEIAIEVAATTAKDVYFPVPSRGVIAWAKAVYSEETDADETITLARATTTVMVITPPADATAEGIVIDGVSDTTNGDLVFDPDSTTDAYQRIKISMPNTFDTAGMIGLVIGYDESAYVAQAASEA